ncbi:MAG: hypothetical protein WC488_02900 [Candidatus Micrarchaeia archaeon]
MCNEIEKHLGELASVGHKRPNGIFFIDGVLKAVSPTHLFLSTSRGDVALLLSEVSKIEFKSQPKQLGGVGDG